MILDVAAILAKMQRDAIGAAFLGHERGFDRIRVVGAASLPQGCDVIDIDPQVLLGAGAHFPMIPFPSSASFP